MNQSDNRFYRPVGIESDLKPTIINKLPEQFPILEHELYKDCPATIHSNHLIAHEVQAFKNHGQTLKKLAERGGLTPVEIYWIMTGQTISWLKSEPYAAIAAIAVEYINAKIKEEQEFKQKVMSL